MLFPRFLFTLLALDPVHAQPLGIDRFAHIEQALLLGAPFALSPRLLLRPRRLLALIRAGRFVLVVGHRRAVFLELVVVLHEAQQLVAQPALVALEQRKAVARGIVAETPGAHVGGFQLNRAIGRSLIVLLGLDLAQFLLEDPRLRLGQAFELPGEAGDLVERDPLERRRRTELLLKLRDERQKRRLALGRQAGERAAEPVLQGVARGSGSFQVFHSHK
jgi:hypothetical protein